MKIRQAPLSSLRASIAEDTRSASGKVLKTVFTPFHGSPYFVIGRDQESDRESDRESDPDQDQDQDRYPDQDQDPDPDHFRFLGLLMFSPIETQT